MVLHLYNQQHSTEVYIRRKGRYGYALWSNLETREGESGHEAFAPVYDGYKPDLSRR